MKPERIERMLQDYLDGRLPAEERAAFEAELRDDPRLSARVEQYRRIGDALREPAAELSPGFYTRAKARFAETHRKEPRWFRVLSWETAGLATAVVLAGAIFLPSLFRSELAPLSPPPDAAPVAAAEEARDQLVSNEAEPVAIGEDSTVAREAATRTAAAEKLLAGDVDLPAKKEKGSSDKKPRLETVPPPASPAIEGEELADRPQFAPVPGRQRVDADEDDRARIEAGARREVPPPSLAAVEPAERQAPRRDPSVRGGLEQQAASPKVDRPGDDIEILVGPPPSLSGIDAGPADAIPLPEGLVEPGAVRQMTDPQAIDRLLRGSDEESILGAASSELIRLVLIGPGSPAFDCATILVGRSRESHEILLRPADRAADSDYGCAVVLPNDSLPITIHLVTHE